MLAPTAKGLTAAGNSVAAVPVVPHRMLANTRAHSAENPAGADLDADGASADDMGLPEESKQARTVERMTENELVDLWVRARWHIIVSQLAPTFLLAVTIWMLTEGLAAAPLPVRLAATGILLASGMLGATAQIAAAQEGLAIIHELDKVAGVSAIGRGIISSARGIDIVRFVGPLVFIGTFAALLWALYL